MDIKELLDDGALDPKKFFNEKEYNTLVIDRGGFNKKENNTADLIEGLLERELSREETEEIFRELKNNNASKILLDAIRTSKRNDERAKLIEACWETGLDFTAEFLFFAELACSDDFQTALEALSVVENIEGPVAESELTKALAFVQNTKSKNKDLVHDLMENIRQRIS